MQSKIKGNIKPIHDPKESELHKKLSEFAQWVSRPKDLAQIRQEQKTSAPKSILPMVF
ncbi:hypothetical protein [Capnocytophaga canimorsus]|uniref:hypothetical protein n=1 Tax=Capnocytophaga canimorsus TaxID=28188 RepID=UPI0013DD8D51|nr:hypothetical protein [Capnocytophaga canimorsus]